MNDLFSASVGLSIPVLAQLAGGSNASPAIWWLVGMAAAAVAFNQVSAAWDRLSGRAQRRELSNSPIEVREAAQFAPRDHRHPEISAQIERMDDRMTTRTESLRREIKEDSKGIHNRIDDVLASVSKVAGQFSQLSKQLREE